VDADIRVARIARRQRGLATHQQCAKAGLSDDQILTRIRVRGWERPRPNVYLLPGVPRTWEQTILAVVLPYQDSWIAHGTAARLHRLPHAPQIGAIEVLRPYGHSTRLDGVTLRRSRLITPADVTTYEGIRVTSLARTIVECSGRLSMKQVTQMIDAAKRVDRRALEDVRSCYARLAGGGRRRLVVIKGALELQLPGCDLDESDLEIRTLRTIVGAGLPIPVQQYRIVIDGKRCRIDLAYPDWKNAIELQSWTWHGGRAPFDDDLARASDLGAMGWIVLPITSQHTDEQIVRWITGALASAAA
jgi:predicted transcriptional regulator of viral defense system